VTKNFFENLVRALENGLCDVDSNGAATSKATSSKNAAGSSKGKSGRGKGTKATVSSRLTDDNEWSCEQCTYANVGSATACAMCNQERQWPTRNTCLLLKDQHTLKAETESVIIFMCWFLFVRLFNINRMKGVSHARNVILLALLLGTFLIWCI